MTQTPHATHATLKGPRAAAGCFGHEGRLDRLVGQTPHAKHATLKSHLAAAGYFGLPRLLCGPRVASIARTLNAEGLHAFISSRFPAFKGERGRPLTPTEDRDAECWRDPGLHLFRASGLQGRAREATRGPQRSRTLNSGGLQAFISSRLPAFKVERGRTRAAHRGAER